MISAQQLLTRREVAERLHISPRTLDRIRQRGELAEVASGEPRRRGRRLLRFAVEEVERWEREHSQKNGQGDHSTEE